MHAFRSPKLIRPLQFGLALLVASSVFASRVSAQRDLSFEPYSVFVAEADAFARCGPSGDYYRTDPLRHGQTLDVYAETDDGWLGIRPPQDSFCWIPADTVAMDEGDETGVIVEDRTVAWIGTHLGRARKYRWQVQLAEGEPVTVVGKSERDGPDGPQLWYRIVPPSGEYRWIHRNEVVQTSEELIATVQRSRNDTPVEAITPSTTPAERPVMTASGQSILSTSVPNNHQAINHQPINNQAIGSGLSPVAEAPSLQPAPEVANSAPAATDPWQNNQTRASSRDQAAASQPATVTQAMKKGGLLASVEFLGRPKLLEIGNGPAAPTANEKPADSNWIAGAVRPAVQSTGHVNQPQLSQATANTQPFNQQQFSPGQFQPAQFQPPMPIATPTYNTPNNSALANLGTPPGAIMQASAVQPIGSQQATHAVPASRITNVVSAERIAQVEAQTIGADVDKLSLIFSRLMAAQASAAEVAPVTRAARTLATSSADALVGGRARLLAERTEQYGRVANRRDGESVIQSSGFQSLVTPTIPGSQLAPASSQTLLRNAAPPIDPSAMEGYLVQVYSARTNSPPFALTDNTGRTLAYVTPIPGVNLRPHLNSKVSVSGNPGFLTGLNTPHIMASNAVRTPE